MAITELEHLSAEELDQVENEVLKQTPARTPKTISPCKIQSPLHSSKAGKEL